MPERKKVHVKERECAEQDEIGRLFQLLPEEST